MVVKVNRRQQQRLRRLAISKAEIMKKCKRFKELSEGSRAFNRNLAARANPYDPASSMDKYQAWLNGWMMARLRAEEKE